MILTGCTMRPTAIGLLPDPQRCRTLSASPNQQGESASLVWGEGVNQHLKIVTTLVRLVVDPKTRLNKLVSYRVLDGTPLVRAQDDLRPIAEHA